MTTIALCLGFFIAGGMLGALMMSWMIAGGRADAESDRNEFSRNWERRP